MGGSVTVLPSNHPLDFISTIPRLWLSKRGQLASCYKSGGPLSLLLERSTGY